MRYPRIASSASAVMSIDAFYGINHHAKIASGEFSDAMNLRMDNGVLNSRPKRWISENEDGYGIETETRRLNGACYNGDDYVEIIDGSLYYTSRNGNEWREKITGFAAPATSEWEIIPYGSYFILFQRMAITGRLRLGNGYSFNRATKELKTLDETVNADADVIVMGCVLSDDSEAEIKRPAVDGWTMVTTDGTAPPQNGSSYWMYWYDKSDKTLYEYDPDNTHESSYGGTASHYKPAKYYTGILFKSPITVQEKGETVYVATTDTSGYYDDFEGQQQVLATGNLRKDRKAAQRDELTDDIKQALYQMDLFALLFLDRETEEATDYAVLKGTIPWVDGMTISVLTNENSFGTIPGLDIARRTPYMDFVVNCQNRLWGCMYGESRDGVLVNEIYASKLGDPTRWQTYQGLASDSYAATVGAAGNYTGAAVINNHPIFFKRDVIEKVYVSASGAHQIQESTFPGVGSFRNHKSIAQHNGLLFYRAVNGYMIYDGNTTYNVSEKIWDELGGQTTNEHVGVVGGKFYLFREGMSISIYGQTHRDCRLYIYDPGTGKWTRESMPGGVSDDTSNNYWVRGVYNNLDQDRDEMIVYYTGTDGIGHSETFLADQRNMPGTQEGDIEWYAETGLIGYSERERKYIGRVNIRLSYTGTVRMQMMYDESGVWESKMVLPQNTVSTRSFDCPMTPKRCDNFRIRLSGTGTVTIYGIDLVYSTGSELTATGLADRITTPSRLQ